MKLRMRAGSGSWAPRPVSGLPDSLILFDGVCILCSSWVRFILEHETSPRFRFMRIQSASGRALATALGIDSDEPETNVVIVGGNAYFKADAALAVLHHLKGYGWTRCLGAIPRPVRNWLYDRVARNRYALFGKDERCLLPSPALAGRIMDEPTESSMS
ncbi:thiol-disulfide oxidoreductase DCC family protein [Microvirga rosea]|uniref:thiol-disulfide oxidoreductase DCC family protein n=1 Tax=Microvirga rosea TaxID=2715425 RepID=UPI001D0AEE2F|nr:DCC1-like thiol-disulfide oxidoreductase family protein [Microvirga rosea]MCB8819060.1 DCC1-like thiol-disulfide oxidoreductase family protein [Microvirga rosea]